MDDARPLIHRSAGGFTLIEIAIVLFIIGLVMSGIVAFINSMIVNRQIEVTKTKQEAIKTTLISFIARNYRLPCPALATLPESNANEGVEATPSGGNCTGITASGSSPNQVVTGTVPWVSLGLTREASLDGYANRFTYQVALGATSLASSTISGMTGRITIHSAGLGVLGAAPTGNQTNDCSSGATVNPCAGVVAIVSHGKDGYGAYTRSGSQIPFDAAVTGNDARENANGDRMFVVKDYSEISTNPFDDIVAILTTNDLLAPLLVAGTLKDYRATLNTTFALIQAAVVSNAIGTVTGSAGNRSYTLPNSISGLLSSSQITDPWGTTIVYARSQNFITASDPASGAAYTLTSNGPDKLSGGSSSADNITLTVTAGDLQSIFLNSGGL